jgi:hypothetical protein
LGTPGLALKSSIVLFSTMSRPGTDSSAPNGVFTLVVSDTALPAASITEMCAVPASTACDPCPYVAEGAARTALMCARDSDACCGESSFSSGTRTKSGSPYQRARSANAARIPLRKEMQVRRGLTPDVAQLVGRDDVQDFPDDRAARAGRSRGEDLPLPEGRYDRRTQHRSVTLQVRLVENASGVVDGRGDVTREVAVVERARPARAYELERGGELWPFDHFAGFVRRAVILVQENLGEARIGRERGAKRCDHRSEVVLHDEAAARQANGGRGHVREALGTEAVECQREARDLTRHRDRAPTAFALLLVDLAVVDVEVPIGAVRSGLAEVDRMGARLVGAVDDHEAPAADSGRGWIYDSRGERRRDRLRRPHCRRASEFPHRLRMRAGARRRPRRDVR